MKIDRLYGEATHPAASAPAPARLLSSDAVHYFWIRAIQYQDSQRGEVAFGRAGEDTPLLSYQDPNFVMPTGVRFRGAHNWIHSCTNPAPQRKG